MGFSRVAADCTGVLNFDLTFTKEGKDRN